MGFAGHNPSYDSVIPQVRQVASSRTVDHEEERAPIPALPRKRERDRVEFEARGAEFLFLSPLSPFIQS
jgi:hypothetical protein